MDFDAVARKVGIKHSGNARKSFKKLWDKLKAGSGAVGVATNGSRAAGGDDSDNDNGDTEVSTRKHDP